MTKAEEMANWLVRLQFEDLSSLACDQLKLRLADALGCAIAPQRGAPLFSEHFPEEMRLRISIQFKDGRTLTIERKDYEGFHTRPIGWDAAWNKFSALVRPFVAEHGLLALFETVQQLESHRVEELTALLAAIARPTAE